MQRDIATERYGVKGIVNLPLQRNPSPTEQKTLLNVYNQQLTAYKTDSAAAEALLKTGYAPLPEKLDKADLAAWTHVARVLLNLHETITRP